MSSDDSNPYGSDSGGISDEEHSRDHSQDARKELDGYGSDSGGDSDHGSPRACKSSSSQRSEVDSSTDGEAETNRYFEEHKNSFEWNERFQSLVEKAYFRMGEHDYSAERQYELSIQLRQLCMEFANEASEIGVKIVKQMVNFPTPSLKFSNSHFEKKSN